MRKFFPTLARLGLTFALLAGGHASHSQSKPSPESEAVPRVALDYLRSNKQRLQLTDADIADLKLSSEAVSQNNGVRHIFLQQTYQGIGIHNAISNVNLTKDGKVLNLGDRFEKEVNHRVAASKGTPLTAQAAVTAAARHLGVQMTEPLAVQKQTGATDGEVLFSSAGISLEPIPAKLVYQPMPDGSLRLAWEVSIYELDAQNYWDIRVDAATGAFLEKNNMVAHCEFDINEAVGTAQHRTSAKATAKSFDFAALLTDPTTNAYNVLPLVTESPSHGPRKLVSNSEADATASPSGWHTTVAGGLYTITRGNNVHAYEDPSNNNNGTLNYSPNAGPSLLFDYPIDFTQQPVTYRDAAITNLFFWNNLMHDMWYQYGLTEAFGSFQVDNFGKGGLGNDDVRAEAQDSRNIPVPPPGVTTRNNANFSTPRDGQRPRMQMYLWAGIPDPGMFQVTAPAGIAGRYPALEGSFSRPLTPTPVTGRLVLAQTTPPPTVPPATPGLPEEGCAAFTNAAAISGNIAVVYRGNCGFADKVQNAQKAGAIAVVVINNVAGPPTVMGGTPTVALPAIVIPAVMISQADGATIRGLLDAQTVVTVALKNDGSGPELDGDLDNGIIAHEYGHGISNRLTGGPNNVSCLGNAEQAGEGWSDWFGLMMTTKPGDTGAKARGIGTYASGQPTTGRGIRPAPYSTDFAVNNFTYAATNNTATISQPHGIGFVWATMIWDLNWAMVGRYGYSTDLYHGTGGNNKTMQLVMDGLKLQVCSPGFVDARNAILAADVADFGGANQELIWRVFARRGLGFNASQGSSNSRTDQVENFDLPPLYACSAPTITVSPATAGFAGAVAKTIYLGYGAQTVTLTASGDPTFAYTWAPAAGLSNPNIANPVFTPTAAGTYTFTVTAVNAAQCTRTATVTIHVINVRCGNRLDKVIVCHNDRELCIGASGVADHLAHGDMVGSCDQDTAPASLSGEPGAARTNVLLTASPNPSNSQTTLAFTLPQRGAYRLEVINMQGALVSVVAEGSGEAGESFAYEFSRGRLAAGLYIVRLVSGKQSNTTKLVLQN